MPKRLAIASLAFTYLFFAEYLSPFRKVYVPFDLWGYHYPLMNYAFQCLRRFSFPAWDPSIYCGEPFAANIQAAVFYPPSWILFAASATHKYLPYRSLEAFIFAHVRLGFLLFFCWLRSKRLSDFASILGAGVFAFSGYAMLQLQHQGLLCGYIWLPLGLWGIDDLAEHRNWTGVMKIAGASAACVLAGYPPTWFVLLVFWFSYSIFYLKTSVILRTLIGIGASLALAAVQLLPTIEASSLIVKDDRYGLGLRDLSFCLSYLIPNFYDFGINVPVITNFGREYLYLGAPAIFGIAALCVYREWRPVVPLLGALAVCLIFLTNPFNLVWQAIVKAPILPQICRDWNFLAGITPAAAGLAAFGLDRFLKSERKLPNFPPIAAVVFAATWATYEIHAWQSFRAGWGSALDAFGMLAVFSICILAARKHTFVAVVLLLSVATDYKVFGTSKRFNAMRGNLPHEYARDGFWGIGPRAFQELMDHKQYRILLDDSAPMPDELRHHTLATPQGFDPFVAERYLDLVRELGVRSQTDRDFRLDSSNRAALETFGVRYAITTDNGPLAASLKTDPMFQLVGPIGYYFHVYRYKQQTEPFAFDGQAQIVHWTPEIRGFRLTTAKDMEFVLREQSFPGWTASLDGRTIPIVLWRGVFQQVRIPSGDHMLEFRYRPRSLEIGAWISVLAILALAAESIRRRCFRKNQNSFS